MVLACRNVFVFNWRVGLGGLTFVTEESLFDLIRENGGDKAMNDMCVGEVAVSCSKETLGLPKI